MNWRLGSHSFHLSLTVLALIAGGLFVYAHLGNSGATQNWLTLAHQEALTAGTWKAQAQSLNTQASRERAAAAFFQDSMGTLEDAFDSLLHLAQTPGAPTVTLGQLGAACHDALTVCQQRGDSLAKADSVDREQAALNLARAVHADSVIALGVKATNCHFLVLFPCPSREQSFFLGAGLTALGAVLTHH